MYRMKVCVCLILFFSLGTAQLDYRNALEKSILFFEGQRSGKLPPNQRLSWRGNSGLQDGSLAKVDLSGGYYDAGDNVKFNFPMAYTTTMLSWNTLEYGKRMGSQLQNARAAIRWATDYFLKCANAAPNKLFVGVGDPNADHKCWERPEDMDTVRSVYYVSPSNPGSDVAGEMAAALAAASLVFRSVDPVYSKKLLGNAVKVFRFAVQYRGSYSDSLGSAACPFYCSYSGYKDELYWGAAWLLRATNDISYLNLINTLGANDVPDLFSWDNKYAGAHVLMSRGIYALVLDGKGSNVQKYNEEYLHIIYDNSGRSVVGNDNRFDSFKQHAEDFVCKVLPNSPYTSTQYTKGGLLYKLPEENLQYVTSITSLLTTYAKYMATKKHTFNCGSLVVTEKTIRSVAKRQVDYILGNNPMKMSYMVGYGHNYPRRIHHRGSSLPSLAMHPQSFGCEAGFQPFYYTANPNPNILVGAIIGGPNQNDFFPDERTDYSHSEPATYINAAIVGPLAYFDSSKR